MWSNIQIGKKRLLQLSESDMTYVGTFIDEYSTLRVCSSYGYRLDIDMILTSS